MWGALGVLREPVDDMAAKEIEPDGPRSAPDERRSATRRSDRIALWMGLSLGVLISAVLLYQSWFGEGGLPESAHPPWVSECPECGATFEIPGLMAQHR